VAVGWASTCTGSAARHLGLLADLLGRRKEAIAYFEKALAMNERMRARPWVAHTQIELARVLGPRSKRSAELLEAGLAEAQTLGMPRLIERAEGAAVTP
jgi:tetratricopeptide (TPR) repeat protein